MDRWQAMETLVHVVEAGSFSGAARRLNVGQPSVSKVVAQLESDLGVQLLLRSNRGLAPTESGLAYYQGARRALDAAAEADSSARGASAGMGGRLVVSAPVTFARLHVMPHLQCFLDQHPQLKLDVVLDDRNIDLLEGGVDVALRLGALSDSAMTARRIGRSPRAVMATPAYLARHGEPRHPADLSQHQSIIYNRAGSGAACMFQCGEMQEPVSLDGRLRVSAAEGVRTAVLADMGIALASEWMFAPELASGQVRRMLRDWTLPAVDLWAVFPSGRKASAKARAFAAFIEDLLLPRSTH
ncbi:LysR family transcriptional regulator [Pseudoduganella sp. FT25W]|jgi:DNA-binding transcriptional LysR family regulator|uniref:LysR family transcriptional regulator n=1 Tax=Duganella alba TaxID=2666081 RepID=A0A6L5QG81_9BURK|nr:LysR family transcriptional regulator [Duganella alba]MRX08719.1 LysR family transcriptional regulator [Duganella alba]MRX18281.1 LysR family transcriptional regulator [Duganella alba]